MSKRNTKPSITSHFEVVVIGGGPAGFKAATDSATAGKTVCIVDPLFSLHGLPTGAHSKCLREAAVHLMRENDEREPKTSFDEKRWSQILNINKRAQSTAERVAAETAYRLRIVVKRGSAEFISPLEKKRVSLTNEESTRIFIKVNDNNSIIGSTENTHLTSAFDNNHLIISSDFVIIATGSTAIRRPPVDFSLPYCFCSDSIQSLNNEMGDFPKNVVVIGGGIIAIEYAQIFAKLGCDSVSLVIRGTAIANVLDESMQELLKEQMVSSGNIRIFWKSTVTRTLSGGAVEIETTTLLNEKDQSQDEPVIKKKTILENIGCLLQATGREGTVKGLGLEKEGINIKVNRRNYIELEDQVTCRVKNCDEGKSSQLSSRMYAIGDCAGGGLATQGQDMGRRAVIDLLSRTQKYTMNHLVSQSVVTLSEEKGYAVWTLPELAYVGQTTKQAIKKFGDGNVITTLVRFSDTVRGMVSHEPGFLKLVISTGISNSMKKGQILGVHIMGETACELVNFGALVVNEKYTVFDILSTVFPAVTLHELYTQSASKAALKLSGASSVVSVVAWGRLNSSIEEAITEIDKLKDSVICNRLLSKKLSIELEENEEGQRGQNQTGGDGTPTYSDVKQAIRKVVIETTLGIKAAPLGTIGTDVVINEDNNPRYRVLHSLFNLFDMDQNGSLDPNELRFMFNESFQLDLSAHEVNGMVEECDSDGDGQIILDEFMEVAKKRLGQLREGQKSSEFHPVEVESKRKHFWKICRNL